MPTETGTRTQSAAQWLYAEGAPRFESEAFGEYHATYRADWSYSAAYREFHTDPRGSQLYRQYGRRPAIKVAGWMQLAHRDHLAAR